MAALSLPQRADLEDRAASRRSSMKLMGGMTLTLTSFAGRLLRLKGFRFLYAMGKRYEEKNLESTLFFS